MQYELIFSFHLRNIKNLCVFYDYKLQKILKLVEFGIHYSYTLIKG